jgi:hypothetical protein
MLQTLHDLSWQFKILLVEPLLAAIGAMLIIAATSKSRAGKPQTWRYFAMSVGWDLIALSLFLTGGAQLSWQHVLWTVPFLISLTACTWRQISRKPLKELRDVPGVQGFMSVFTVVYFLVMATLLIDGR